MNEISTGNAEKTLKKTAELRASIRGLRKMRVVLDVILAIIASPIAAGIMGGVFWGMFALLDLLAPTGWLPLVMGEIGGAGGLFLACIIVYQTHQAVTEEIKKAEKQLAEMETEKK